MYGYVHGQIKPQYAAIEQITTSKGLANNRVFDMLVDHNQFLWTLTANGIQVYNGNTFSSITDIQTEYDRLFLNVDNRVIVVQSDYIIALSNSGLAKDTLYQFPEETKSIPNGQITTTGLDIIKAPYHIRISPSNEVKQLAYEASTFVPSQSTLSCNIKNGFLYRDAEKQFATKNNRASQSLYHQGKLIQSYSNKITIQDGGNYIAIPYPNGKSIRYANAIYAIDENSVLISANRQLFTLDISTAKWTQQWLSIANNKLINQGNIEKILADKYGNIYIITVNQGVLKIYTNQHFGYMGNIEGETNFVKAIYLDERRNILMASGLHSGLSVYDLHGHLIHQLNRHDHPAFKNVAAIYPYKDDEYLLYSLVDNSIRILQINNDAYEVKSTVDHAQGYYGTYLQDADKSFIFQGAQYQLDYPKLHRKNQAGSIIFDAEYIRDSIYVGMPNAIGVMNINGESIRTINMPNLGYIRGISAKDESTLFVGADQGLFHYNLINGKLSKHYSGCVYSVLADDQGSAWCGTDRGLLHVDADEKSSMYSLEDGIQSLEFNTNSIAQDSRTGIMYFGGVNGITYFDPKKVKSQNHETEMLIDGLKVNNESISLNEESSIHLAFDENNIELNLVASGPYMPSTYNYQYRLGDENSNWVNNGNNTRVSMTLAPGNYEFHALANKRFDADQQSTSAILNICISEPWWKSWWFYILSSAFIIGLISYLIYIWQKRKYIRKKHEWEIKNKLQKERLRISRDLHDNIGSQITYMVSSLDNLKYQQNIDVNTKDKIESINSFGKQTIEELRNTIWVLKKESTTYEELQSRIRAYIERCNKQIATMDIRFEADYESSNIEISSNIAIHLFRIIQETLQNSVKHSKGDHVLVTMDLVAEQLEIRIKDNGIGMKSKNPEGYGMKTIRDRVAILSGQLEIDSDDNGSQVYISAPLTT